MRSAWLPLIVALLAVPSRAAMPDPALRAAVVQLASLLSDGDARLDPADITVKQSGAQVAVLFALQGAGGGNGRWQYLAFFAPNEDLPRSNAAASRYRLLGFAQIGSRGVRLFDARSAVLRQGRLLVNGADYEPKDAMCCPSRRIRAAFSMTDGRVLEQRLPAGE